MARVRDASDAFKAALENGQDAVYRQSSGVGDPLGSAAFTAAAAKNPELAMIEQLINSIGQQSGPNLAQNNANNMEKQALIRRLLGGGQSPHEKFMQGQRRRPVQSRSWNEMSGGGGGAFQFDNGGEDPDEEIRKASREATLRYLRTQNPHLASSLDPQRNQRRPEMSDPLVFTERGGWANDPRNRNRNGR